jgi:hypothetical protein
LSPAWTTCSKNSARWRKPPRDGRGGNIRVAAELKLNELEHAVLQAIEPTGSLLDDVAADCEKYCPTTDLLGRFFLRAARRWLRCRCGVYAGQGMLVDNGKPGEAKSVASSWNILTDNALADAGIGPSNLTLSLTTLK